MRALSLCLLLVMPGWAEDTADLTVRDAGRCVLPERQGGVSVLLVKREERTAI